MSLFLFFIFMITFLIMGTFSIFSLGIIFIFPLVLDRILKSNLSKRDMFITIGLDITLVILILWKGIYFFTPFFWEPSGLSMDLSNWEIIYCGCIFIFPIYLSVLFLVLLLGILGLKYYHIYAKMQWNKNKIIKKVLIWWTIILIPLSLIQSSIYANYFPYGFYKSHTIENFNKNRNIIIDIWNYFLEEKSK